MAKSKRQREQREIRYTDAAAWAREEDRGFAPTTVKLPEGVEFFRFEKEGNYKIDVIPYVAGKGNPRADEGFIHYERTYYCHRGLGLDGKTWQNCLQQFGKKCPVCIYLAREGKNLDEDYRKQLKAQQRMLFNVIDRTTRDSRAKGVQVFDTAFYRSFGMTLKEKIGAIDDYATFFHLSGGYTLLLKVAKQTWSGGSYLGVTNIEMLPRKEDYPESILDDAVCLDDALVEKTYKELDELLHAGENDSDDEDEEPSKTTVRKGGPITEDEDEEDDEDDSDLEPDDEDEDDEDEDDSDLEDEEDEDGSDLDDEELEEEEPPKKTTRKAPAKKTTDKKPPTRKRR